MGTSLWRGGARARLLRTALFVVLAQLAVLLAAPAPGAQAAVELPAGFSLQSMATGHPEGNLSNFEFLPGDGVLLLGRNGLVTVVSGDGPPRTLATLPGTASLGDLGALGLTLAPDYALSGRLYTMYTHDAPAGRVMRVSAWTASPPENPTTLAGERVILDVPLGSNYHGGGTVLVAPDGKLLISVGDNAPPIAAGHPDALRAQDLDLPYGKILRVDPATGAGVPGNPFHTAATASSWRSRTYAYGLRNPFRMSADPRNGRVLVGDVGWMLHEELDTLTAGANYGWPCFEGPIRHPSYDDSAVCQRVYAQPTQAPLWTYPSPNDQSSIVGGTWYTGSSYPDAYKQAYFVADYSRQKIWTLMIDEQGRITRGAEAAGFATGAGAPVAMKPGPNGDIYFADIVSSRLMRLRYSAGNRAPVPQASTSVDPATRTVTFDGSSSYDLDDDPITYQWDFGDGQQAEGAMAGHTYATAGPYTATLTVRDPLGGSATTTMTVAPDNHAPQLTLTGPDKKYAVGDPVAVSATAGDVEDGPLQVSWRTDLIHCDGNGGCHLHPGRTSTGPTLSETFQDHGEDTRIQITASATDSDGVRTQRIYSAEPDLRTLTVLSPAPVLINAGQRTSAKVTVGSRNEVTAPAVYGQTVFTRWSDGGTRIHPLTMPAADRTLTAHYAPLVRGRYADYNADGRTDVAVYRPQTKTWWNRSLFTTPYGAAGDVPLPADLNSDGMTDVVLWRPSTGGWLARGLFETRYGQRGDVPVPGDYNGDRQTDLAVWRPATGIWHVRNGTAVGLGVRGDIPVPGDYNGDGKQDAAVWRPSTGVWLIRGRAPVRWGQPGDVPVPGDFNGDRRTDLAIWRPSTGQWWVLGRTPQAQTWGAAGDVPLSGDFTGDGRADLAIWRPSTGIWWVAGMAPVGWGVRGDQPLARPAGSRS